MVLGSIVSRCGRAGEWAALSLGRNDPLATLEDVLRGPFVWWSGNCVRTNALQFLGQEWRRGVSFLNEQVQESINAQHKPVLRRAGHVVVFPLGQWNPLSLVLISIRVPTSQGSQYAGLRGKRTWTQGEPLCGAAAQGVVSLQQSISILRIEHTRLDTLDYTWSGEGDPVSQRSLSLSLSLSFSFLSLSFSLSLFLSLSLFFSLSFSLFSLTHREEGFFPSFSLSHFFYLI